MNKDNPTTEDDLREEYDLKHLKVRKLGSERKIFDGITTLFRRSSNNSIQKAQKIENKILARINNPGIVCKVIFDTDNNVEIFFEHTKNEEEIKDIYLYEALNAARKNTQEHQDIKIFLRDDSGNHPLFFLREEIDSHNSMEEILSYYPDRNLFKKTSRFNRKMAINFLRGRQAVKQLTHLYEKEELQQKKFVSEQKTHTMTAFPIISSCCFTLLSIFFVGYPGVPESSIIKKFSNSSVDYKTCEIKTKKTTPAKKDKDPLCTFNQLSYELIILYFLVIQLVFIYYDIQNKNDLLIINYALDIFPEKLPENDELKQ